LVKRQISDAAVAAIIGSAGKLPTPECAIFVAHLGGAINRGRPSGKRVPAPRCRVRAQRAHALAEPCQDSPWIGLLAEDNESRPLVIGHATTNGAKEAGSG
jgi:hypothetical protein